MNWSDEAAYALVALETKLAERYPEGRAAQIIGELVRRVERLQDHPQLGCAVPEYGHWHLGELVDKWDRTLYRLLPDAIEIVTMCQANHAVGSGSGE